MNLKIVNETDYQTADLRRFLAVGFREEGVDFKESWGRYVVEFYRPRGCVAGQALYHSTWMRLALYNSDGELAPAQVVRLAQVFVHELAHNRGLRHKEMTYSSEIDVPWAAGLRVRRKVVKPKPVRDVQAERQTHAEKMLAEHDAKLKREQKLVKKWRQKVRYYGRVFEQRKAADKA